MKNAFVGADGVLKAWGYIDANADGDVAVPVSNDFELEPRQWMWDGKAWQPIATAGGK